MKLLISVFASLLAINIAIGQKTIRGSIYNQHNAPIEGANIYSKLHPKVGTTSRADGSFSLAIGYDSVLQISHVQHLTKELFLSPHKTFYKIILDSHLNVLEEVSIEEKANDGIGIGQTVEGKDVVNLPSALGDFNKVLLTFIGVSGNNELSSAYNVRGGNFDENLVYVNEIPIYRPFLSNAGRQEGLSFINPSLVKNIKFYPGGWSAHWGDKLSSLLAIDYKEPEILEGEVSVSLLGASAYTGGKVSNRIKYLLGARYTNSKYLLNSLEVKGQYFPSYIDIQSFLSFDLDKKHTNKTKLNWLLSYSRNDYNTTPSSQTTEFGTFNNTLRIVTAFEGNESLKYNTIQTGINLSHLWNERIISRWIGAITQTREVENFNLEGAYRICDISTDLSDSSFNRCITERGTGINYDYGRNRLKALLMSGEWKNEFSLRSNILLRAGVGFKRNVIEDQISEYTFIDSAGFVTQHENIDNDLNITTHTTTAYLEGSIFSIASGHELNVGVRFNHLDYNQQSFISPRLLYTTQPWKKRETYFKVAIGSYNQAPFYRELRSLDGNIQNNIKAQKSWHYILSTEHLFNWSGRSFLFVSQAYYKNIKDAIAYDIDNLKIRYFNGNSTKAYALGVDFRVHGEFIKGTQSWFSLGFLKTKEDVIGDMKQYIRRPLDQTLTLAFHFEDHLLSDSSVRININTVIGSGYPTGPPNNLSYRNVFNGDEYFRVDVGLSKTFTPARKRKLFKTFTLRAEILNALGNDNTLSYTWINDVTGGQLAIPNSLSARLLNLRLKCAF